MPAPAERNGPALAVTSRTGLRRMHERGTHERAVLDAILDAGLLCHVGVADERTPVVTPMAYARVGDLVYLHGAPANRTLGLLATGAPACVTVTLLDGLVLARSAFHHSVNYRAVMLFGRGHAITDPDEKLAASVALLDHMVPGRSADARLPNQRELRSTLVIGFPIVEGSAKVRTGGPKDDDEDLDLPIWAGVIPLETVARTGVAEADLPSGTPVPPYARRLPPR